MKDLIVIGGSPGSGKTTLAVLLKDKLESPWIDYGRLREFHLDREWKKANEQEEQLTFENLIFIIKNYQKHGYKNVIVDDLQDFRVRQIPDEFKQDEYIIFSLTADEAEIEKRITARNDGWKDVPGAQEWNNELRSRASVANEHKIDTTGKTPENVLKEVLEILKI